MIDHNNFHNSNPATTSLSSGLSSGGFSAVNEFKQLLDKYESKSTFWFWESITGSDKKYRITAEKKYHLYCKLYIEVANFMIEALYDQKT